jgi:hypothetical protein
MYNTKVNITYNTSEVFLESDEITEDEKGFIRDTLYRQELLNIFGIEEYNEKKIDLSIHKLYKKIQNCNEFKDCMIKLASYFMSEEEELGLMILFSYDYMYLTHICISEYLETNKVSENNMKRLKALIF